VSSETVSVARSPVLLLVSVVLRALAVRRARSTIAHTSSIVSGGLVDDLPTCGGISWTTAETCVAVDRREMLAWICATPNSTLLMSPMTLATA